MTPYEQSLALCTCGDRTCLIPYGFCHCGCGAITSIAKFTYRKICSFKGKPKLFLSGHALHLKICPRVPIRYGEVEGEPVTFFPLTGSHVAIIDRGKESEIHPLWHVTSSGYAARLEPKTWKTISMHRLFMGAHDGEKVDHKNGNKLDNRISNLRLATDVEQAQNRGVSSRNTSGVTGVSKVKKRNNWVSYITVNKLRIFLGESDTLEEAVEKRKVAERKHFGEFTRKAI